MSHWQPDTQNLNELVKVLRNATSGSSETQKAVMKQLEDLKQHIEYPNYLCHVFCWSQEPENIRTIAGLELKNCMPGFDFLSIEQQLHLKQSILLCLESPSEMVSRVAGSCITSIISGHLKRWPDVLPRLIDLLGKPSSLLAALSAIEKICEDSANELDVEDSLFVGHLINCLLGHIQNPTPKVRSKVLKVIDRLCC